MKRVSLTLLLCGAVASATFAGCVNPNAIGVQDYGSITGRVVDARTQKPIAGALASVGSTIARYSDSGGAFLLMMVPSGSQTVVITANGYQSTSVQVAVVKDQQSVVDPVVGLQPLNP